MQIETSSPTDLTYCTNIHPANGWLDVMLALELHAPRIKAAVAPDQPFGIGLRLSGDESRELLEDTALQNFQAQLDDLGCYVALINGFPHGPFHNTTVKADVHAPDWRSDERVDYTCRLADILSRLVPAGMDGGISTNPLSYDGWIQRDGGLMDRMTANLLRCVGHLAELKRTRGCSLHIDMEPEPDGVIETSEQFVDFFESRLLPIAQATLPSTLGVAASDVESIVREHVCVCLDTCHAAVMYEPIETCVDRYRNAGITIGRVQISSAVRAPFGEDGHDAQQTRQALGQFAESVYLHQVVSRRNDASFARFPDLPQALAAAPDELCEEWRVHFHVPVFAETFDRLGSTQFNIREILDLHQRSPVSRHFEIETYTWDVLPPSLKLGLADSIIREYEWVLDHYADSDL